MKIVQTLEGEISGKLDIGQHKLRIIGQGCQEHIDIDLACPVLSPSLERYLDNNLPMSFSD